MHASAPEYTATRLISVLYGQAGANRALRAACQRFLVARTYGFRISRVMVKYFGQSHG